MAWHRLDETVRNQIVIAEQSLRDGLYLRACSSTLEIIRELKRVYENRNTREDREVYNHLRGIQAVVRDISNQTYLKEVRYNQFVTDYISYILMYLERAYWYRIWELDPERSDYESKEDIFQQLKYSYRRLTHSKRRLESTLSRIQENVVSPDSSSENTLSQGVAA